VASIPAQQTARQFAAMAGADLVIVGHMPCADGFRSPNPVQLILDSSHFPACYCLFSNQHPIALSDLLSVVRSL
jgi:hypothetical protein